MEVPLRGRQIDLVRGELLIEIQTSSLGALRPKLRELVQEHPVRVVLPVAAETWIVRLGGAAGRVVSRRKSPKRGRLEHAFYELVSLPKLFREPNFSLEVALVAQEEVRRHAPGRARRRKGWVTVERRLLEVRERHLFRRASDLSEVLPSGLPAPFTTADLAARLEIPRNLAQKMAYCLREAGALRVEGKRGNARLYGRRC